MFAHLSISAVDNTYNSLKRSSAQYQSAGAPTKVQVTMMVNEMYMELQRQDKPTGTDNTNDQISTVVTKVTDDEK